MVLAAHVAPHGTAPHVVAAPVRDGDAPVARNRRRAAGVEQPPAGLRSRRHPLEERGFVPHGTVAGPRWLDLSLQPNDREPGCSLGDPQVVNNGPVALARFST